MGYITDIGNPTGKDVKEVVTQMLIQCSKRAEDPVSINAITGEVTHLYPVSNPITGTDIYFETFDRETVRGVHFYPTYCSHEVAVKVVTNKVDCYLINECRVTEEGIGLYSYGHLLREIPLDEAYSMVTEYELNLNEHPVTERKDKIAYN